MATFKERIEDLAGSVPAGIDSEQFLNDGVADTIHRLEIINPSKLDLFGKTESVNDGNGITVNTIFLYASRNGYKCEMVNPSMKDKYIDVNSIYLATETYPICYKVGEVLYIIPAPTAEANGSVRYVNYGTVTNFDSGASAISEFPSSMYHIPVTYAAIQVLNEKIRNFSFSELSEFPTSPSEPSLDTVSSSLPTFTAPDAVSIPDPPSDADIDFSGLPSLPSFNKPDLSLPSIPIISDLTISATAPIAPATPSISSSGISSTTINVSESPPEFDNTAINTSIGNMSTYIGTEEDIEKATAKGQEVQIRLQNALNEFNEGVAKYNAAVQVALRQAQVSASEAEKEANFELQADIEDYRLQLSRFQASVQNYQAQINDEVSEFSSNLKKEMALYDSEVRALLGEYTADIQNESAKVNTGLDEYKSKLAKAIQTYTAETGYDLSKYSARVTAVLNEHKSNMSMAIANFQQELESYRLENASVSARNNEKIGKYQVDSTVYQADIQKVLQKYSIQIQKDTVNIKTLESSYIKLKTEYEQYFVPFQRDTK